MLTLRRPDGPCSRGTDDGFTLTEVVVSMALATLVAAMAMTFFVATGRAARSATDDSFDNQSARSALATVTGWLRLAKPGSLSSGDSTNPALRAGTVTFTANDGAVPGCAVRAASTVTITIRAGSVLLTRTGPVSAPTPSAPCAFQTNVTGQKVLASGLKAGAFGYAASDGSDTTSGATVATVTVWFSVYTGTTPRRIQSTATLVGVNP